MQVLLPNRFARVSFTDESLSLDEFIRVANDNPDLRMERSVEGELLIVPGAGGRTGNRNFEINGQLREWILRTGSGIGFDSSTQFVLPSGAVYSPDAAWIAIDRWDALSQDQQDRFPPLCPDFVIELMSPSDRLSTAQAKMQEWIANGVRLGWLIDPKSRAVYVYRPSAEVEVVRETCVEAGAPVDGFRLDLSRVWR